MKYLLLFSLLWACSGETSFSEKDKAQVLEETQDFLDRYHRSIEQHGLTAEKDYLDASDDFFWVPPGYHSALTIDSVLSILEQNAPFIQSITYEWEYLDIYPLSKSHAVYTGKLHSQSVDTSGNPSEVVMLETGTLIKRAKGWQILNGQSRIIDSEANNF